MKLQDYIKRETPSVAAEKLGVTYNTAWRWMTGSRRPEPSKAQEIERITEGLVRMHECYQSEKEEAP